MKRRILIALAVLVIWTLWANTALEVNEWRIDCPGLPEEFDGLRIAQVSDLHNAQFGEGNEKLLSLLREAEPDVIFLTGDLIDSTRTDIELALAFVREAVGIAPCYYVSGNHESRIGQWKDLYSGLIEAGVTVLENEKTTLERSGEAVSLLGLTDPAFGTDLEAELEDLMAGEEGFTILLSHRPEVFESYCEAGVGLVFSGHAHGGQVRLPLVGGLIAPNQGFFPEYDSGLYASGDTQMLVSRGIGNSIVPLRFNNRPEILLVVLKAL